MIGFSRAFLVYFPENEKVTYSNDENKSLYKSGAFQLAVYNKNEEGPNQVVKWQKIKNIFDKRSLFEIWHTTLKEFKKLHYIAVIKLSILRAYIYKKITTRFDAEPCLILAISNIHLQIHEPSEKRLSSH